MANGVACSLAQWPQHNAQETSEQAVHEQWAYTVFTCTYVHVDMYTCTYMYTILCTLIIILFIYACLAS